MYTDIEQYSFFIPPDTIYNADFVIDDFGNLVFIASNYTFAQVMRHFYQCPIEGCY